MWLVTGKRAIGVYSHDSSSTIFMMFVSGGNYRCSIDVSIPVTAAGPCVTIHYLFCSDICLCVIRRGFIILIVCYVIVRLWSSTFFFFVTSRTSSVVSYRRHVLCHSTVALVKLLLWRRSQVTVSSCGHRPCYLICLNLPVDCRNSVLSWTRCATCCALAWHCVSPRQYSFQLISPELGPIEKAFARYFVLNWQFSTVVSKSHFRTALI